jgi:hypothetical protein
MQETTDKFDENFMNRTNRLVAFCMIGLLALAACNTANQKIAQPPTATLALIVSQTPRLTATPVSTRTPLPTFTYTPSDTPIPSETPIPPTPTDPPPLVAIVASSQRVNVREGPGVSFGSIFALDPGTGVEVLGQSEDGDWYNIQMEDGDEGWISSSLLRLQATPTLPPSLTPTQDETALALGTTFPTAILGGAPVTPTLPSSVLALSQTPADAAAGSDATVESAGGNDVVDSASINQTATALSGNVVDASVALTQAAERPQGGPTGGPSNIENSGSSPSGGQAGGVTAADTAADILAYCSDPFIGSPPPRNLRPGQSIRVYWSWFARTESQIENHTTNVSYDVRVNGTPLTTWRQYGLPPRRQEDGNYYKYWYVPFGPLEAGEYEISYRVTWRTLITDGYDEFGPGTSNTQQTGTCTFTVGG